MSTIGHSVAQPDDSYVVRRRQVLPWSAEGVVMGPGADVEMVGIDGHFYLVPQGIVERVRQGRAAINGPNCFEAVLGAVYSHLGGAYVDTQEARYYLDRDWLVVSSEKVRPADLILYEMPYGSHIAYYLGNGMVFHKGSMGSSYKYTFARYHDIEKLATRVQFLTRRDPKNRYPIPNTPQYPPALLPMYQYHLLSTADIIGSRRYDPRYLSLLSNIYYISRDFFHKWWSGLDLNPGERYAQIVEPSLIETYLRHSSLDEQVLELFYDEDTKDGFVLKEGIVGTEPISRVRYLDRLDRDMLAYLVSLGIPSEKIPQIFHSMGHYMEQRNDAALSSYHHLSEANEASYKLFSHITNGARILGGGLEAFLRPGKYKNDGRRVVGITPLDIFLGTDHVMELLDGARGKRTRLTALPHPVVMMGAMYLLNSWDRLKVLAPEVDSTAMQVVGAIRMATARHRMMSGRL